MRAGAARLRWVARGGRVPSFVMTALVVVMLGGAAACGPHQPHFPREVTLGGQRVTRATLRKGEFAYMRWCRSCHGQYGGGDGEEWRAGTVPPRDLRLGIYAYAGVPEGALPPDAFFERIVGRGIPGSGMKPLPVPAARMAPLIAYLKWLSPRWRHGRPVAPAPVPTDPWKAGDGTAAVARGREVMASSCTTCHDHHVLTPTRFGYDAKAPDLARDPLGGGDTTADLYRSTAAGLAGTAMKGFAARLTPRDLWAVVHTIAHERRAHAGTK